MSRAADEAVEYLKAHGRPVFEPRPPVSKSFWARLFRKSGVPYVVDYVHPTGVRMPLTEAEWAVFVPAELEIVGSIDGYRRLLAHRIAQRG